MARELSTLGDRQFRNDAQERGRFVRRQRGAAGGEDLGLQPFASDNAFAQDDLGGDQRSGDRILAREDAACAHGVVSVERRFDLFGMHLRAADVDDAAAPSGEQVAIAAPFDDVARIDEAVRVMQRRRPCPR